MDEDSIKVDGFGAATITDLSVDLLPNRESYEEIYPSDSEDDESDEEEEEDDELEAEDDAVKSVTQKLKTLGVQLLDEQEKINSAASRLKICENYGQSILNQNKLATSELENAVKAYNIEREKIYLDHKSSTATAEAIQDQIKDLEKERAKLRKAAAKAQKKAMAEKTKLQMKKLRQKNELRKEKERIKAERNSFWPKKVYRVTISLEPSTLTPSSSRRGSIDSESAVKLASSPAKELSESGVSPGTVNISLSYITYSASWSPRYDLSLNTISCTGELEYSAVLRNNTSETWKDAKVILSTSQASFRGLADAIPTLQPWHVRLVKSGRNPEMALFSSYELKEKQNDWSKSNLQMQKPRHELFGRDAYGNVSTTDIHARFSQKPTSQAQQSNSYQPQANATWLGFGQNATVAGSSSLFGAPRSVPPPPAAPLAPAGPAWDRNDNDESALEESALGLGDDVTLAQAEQALTFDEGAWEESGMTTTYDVPALKTLAPSNSTIKHKIAKIHFNNISFSHIIIAKLRPVAFLKAQLQNRSKITLLKGPLGLTLDDSFLGQTTLPRCSSGETFSLSLGVDPTITVNYPKPTAKRSQTGIFAKEDCNVFSRSVTITNTKPNSVVSVNVLDQVPISEDERLKIEILEPRGLKLGGDSVRAGSGILRQVSTSNSTTTGRNSVPREIKWGTALATAKKSGEVIWKVQLNPGQGVKLPFEYEATFPSGEGIAGL